MKQPAKHRTLWEDQRSAMLGTCGDHNFSPGNAPILEANKPIRCPHCQEYITLRWKVFIKQVTEDEFYEKNNLPRPDIA